MSVGSGSGGSTVVLGQVCEHGLGMKRWGQCQCLGSHAGWNAHGNH